eukprot:334180-Rhodomonas_salina.1
MQSPVLSQHMLLRASYAVRGTDGAYAATRLPCRFTTGGREGGGGRGSSGCYGHVTSAMSLRACYAMSGTDVGYVVLATRGPGVLSTYALATQCPVLSWCMMLPGTGGTGGESGTRRGGLRSRVLSPYPPTRRCPRMASPYAMPGTDLAYGGCAIYTYPVLAVCSYAVSGTNFVYAATRCSVVSALVGELEEEEEGKEGGGAVSYTHLRAHETEADL